MRQYKCVVCGEIYDEAQGDPASNIPPGTRWEDIPADWVCPECGATKSDFELVLAA
jgi:rubredoxin